MFLPTGVELQVKHQLQATGQIHLKAQNHLQKM